jgi:hypothetical protein
MLSREAHEYQGRGDAQSLAVTRTTALQHQRRLQHGRPTGQRSGVNSALDGLPRVLFARHGRTPSESSKNRCGVANFGQRLYTKTRRAQALVQKRTAKPTPAIKLFERSIKATPTRPSTARLGEMK